MICSKCGNAEAVTNGVLAFTKPDKGNQGVIPEDVSGEFCKPCVDSLFTQYVITYRPEKISRAEARDEEPGNEDD